MERDRGDGVLKERDLGDDGRGGLVGGRGGLVGGRGGRRF